MKTLERYEAICMNYFNGNISDFKRDLKGLTKKEILTLLYQLAARLGGVKETDRAANMENLICSQCGITAEQRAKLPPMPTGINHPSYRLTTSFFSGGRGQVWCPECHKEEQLRSLMRIMDAYALKYGEEALAKQCGVGKGGENDD